MKLITNKGMANIRKNENPIVWLDLEMTGLDFHLDKILEASCIITDHNLNIIAEAPNLIIHQSEDVLSSMNEWCIKKHHETGLTELCRKSDITLEAAEKTLLKFLKQHVPKGVCPLAGNTIYMDRIFIKEYMPQVENYLHYRIIDVSSIKELCKRWNPEIFSNAPEKKLVHRSTDDIKESIEELKYYRNFMFNNNK